MADLTITAASVANLSGIGKRLSGTAGGTITAGMPVRVGTNGRLVASANTSAANAKVDGIALNGASDGQPVSYQAEGSVNLGATLAVGKVYVLSAAGLISPVDDVAAADFVTVIGVGVTASSLKLGICASDVAAAADVT
jgi:hypothetical protein